MRTILFNSEKGGTGKTTLSTLYASYRAMRGDNVLVIDLSAQASATLSFGVPKSGGLYDCIVRGVPIPDRWTVPGADVWIPPGNEPGGVLCIVPGNSESALIPMADHVDPGSLGAALAEVEGMIDLVVIDSDPVGGMLLTLAWDVADSVVIPTQLSRLSIAGLDETVARARKAGVAVAGIVPNMCDLRTVVQRLVMEELETFAAGAGIPLLTAISHYIAWQEASFIGSMIYAADVEMTKARVEAIRFCKEVDGVVVR